MRVTGVAPLIVVRDVARSVAFYRRLGFQPAVEWSTYAKLHTDDGAVMHVAAQGDPPPDRPTVALAAPDGGRGTATAAIVISVDDCRLTCEALSAAGVELLTAPAEPAWGGEVRAFLWDPDDHLIEINEPLD